MPMVTMTVNGQPRSAEAEGRTLLSQFLREALGLTGTHVGCDTSQCGCCIVEVDGRAVKSCAMLAQEAEGARITTIEGQAAEDGTMSKVQAAFVQEQGLQCGFCTPGMVMSVTELLRHTPKPSIDEIKHHLEGNICRCTGYRNIIKAVLVASDQPLGALASDH
ncbi:MAG: (2Fe-2S)-binding protein [Rhodobacteraceae bacterium]|nr:(2Fe-2S)-binding protein [Paracoccaceae bacterium]MBR9821041.1 (2Fe-2S)-binding protein [Paracoccaceae bacterium]